MCNVLGYSRNLFKEHKVGSNNHVKLRFTIDTNFKLVKRMCKYNTYINLIKNPHIIRFTLPYISYD